MQFKFLLLTTLAFSSLFIGINTSEAAIPTSTFSSIVKLRVQNDQMKDIGSGAGIIIDSDGHILTSYQAIKPWEGFKKQPIIVCSTIDPFTEPRCTMRAVVRKASALHDLALLQVQSIHHEDSWMTIEERMLRGSFSLPFSRIHTTATTELVELGEELALIGYPATGGTTMTYTKTSVTGFQKRQHSTTTIPWLIKTESKFTSTNIGGAAFSLNGIFLGMPTHTSGTKESLGHIISLPVISTFLKEALGKDYVLGKKIPALQGPLVGIHNGKLQTTMCPEFATLESGGKACRCRAGFFAIGNTCMAGQVYCPLRFSNVSSYDGFIKQCLCPNANGGSTSCTLPKPISPPNPSTPKPTPEAMCAAMKNAAWNAKQKSCDCNAKYRWNAKKTACEIISTPIPSPTCPSLGSYNTSTRSCVCAKPFVLNQKKDACIFIGKPMNTLHLQRCEFIGKFANMLYYPKGHSVIKQMTHVGKQCFATEEEAKKSKFKRTAK